MAWLARVILGFLGGLAKSWILKPLASGLSIIFMWGFHALVRASPGRAFELMKDIEKAYHVLPTEWAGFIASYLNEMTGGKISADDITKISGRTAMEQLGETFLSPMLGLIMPDPKPEGGIEPQAGIDGAERFLGVNLQFQMSAWLLHVLGDMMSFGIFKSLKDLPNAISWSYGIGWLSWLVMGTPFQMGIADPLREHFNRMYKPARFSVAQNIEAYQKGLITAAEMVDNMRFLGWTDDRTNQLYQLARKDPGEATLRKLYEIGVLTQEEVKTEVRYRGYSPAWTELITDLITKDRELDQRDKLLSQLEDLYLYGAVEETELRDGFSRAGWKSREIELAITRLDAEKTRRSQLSDADLANAVEKDLRSWAEVRGILMSRGYSRRDADIFMKLRIPEKKWLG